MYIGTPIGGAPIQVTLEMKTLLLYLLMDFLSHTYHKC